MVTENGGGERKKEGVLLRGRWGESEECMCARAQHGIHSVKSDTWAIVA